MCVFYGYNSIFGLFRFASFIRVESIPGFRFGCFIHVDTPFFVCMLSTCRISFFLFSFFFLQNPVFSLLVFSTCRNRHLHVVFIFVLGFGIRAECSIFILGILYV